MIILSTDIFRSASKHQLQTCKLSTGHLHTPMSERERSRLPTGAGVQLKFVAITPYKPASVHRKKNRKSPSLFTRSSISERGIYPSRGIQKWPINLGCTAHSSVTANEWQHNFQAKVTPKKREQKSTRKVNDSVRKVHSALCGVFTWSAT